MGVLIIPDEGKEYIAKFGLAVNPSSYRQVRLFKNNFTPTVATVRGDITEANYNGYNGVAIGWTLNGIVGGDLYEWVMNDQLFQKTAGGTSNTCYGWYIDDYIEAKLIAIKLFDAGPKSFVLGGDAVTVSATFQLGAS